jgi:alpha-beta hydrolase superfamily lysophospholipase
MNVRLAFASDCRFALRRGRGSVPDQNPQSRLIAGIAADPRARLRCGSFAASDGADVPYRLWLFRKPQAAVVLLHGAFDYSAAFDEIGPRLARAGFAALAFDQRGFGATASRGTWAGVARMADDIADAGSFLLGRLHAEVPLFVLGESMGGAVAVHSAAANNIHGLSGLVLAAPGALASRFRQRLLAWFARAARNLSGDAELVFERLSGWELTPAAAIRLIGDPLVMRRIRPEMLCGMADLALSAVEEARKVTVPVLTMVGARDEFVRPACIRRLFDNLAGEKTWRVVADAPHLLLHWQRSGEIVREAARWIAARSQARDDEQRRDILPISRDACGAGARVG